MFIQNKKLKKLRIGVMMVMKQTYIVYMGELPLDRKSVTNAHHNILSEAIGE